MPSQCERIAAKGALEKRRHSATLQTGGGAVRIARRVATGTGAGSTTSINGHKKGARRDFSGRAGGGSKSLEPRRRGPLRAIAITNCMSSATA